MIRAGAPCSTHCSMTLILSNVSGPSPACAVPHAGSHEEADPVRGLFGISAEIEHRFVEFDAGAGSYLLISPSMIDEQLTAVFREGREMGIEFVDILVDRVRLCSVALKIETSPVPVGILIHDIAELVEKEIGRVRAAGETGPGELGSRLQAREENLARTAWWRG